MGSTGKSTSGNEFGLINSASGGGEYQELYRDTLTPENGSDEPVLRWFNDTANSNLDSWTSNLSPDEKHAISRYTGQGYQQINTYQYTTPWEKMGNQAYRDLIMNLHNGLNKFELNKGIVVDRACDFQIFGANRKDLMSVDQVKDFLSKSNGVVQNDGFMSFSANRGGEGIEGRGLLIHLRVPPSTGAGAYVDHMSQNDGEREFILNNNAVLRFDPKSVYEDKVGRIHINADWLGRARAQTISKTNKSALRKNNGK